MTLTDFLTARINDEEARAGVRDDTQAMRRIVALAQSDPYIDTRQGPNALHAVLVILASIWRRHPDYKKAIEQ